MKIDIRVKLMEENSRLLKVLITEVGGIDGKLEIPKQKKENNIKQDLRAQEVDVELPPYLEAAAEKIAEDMKEGDYLIFDVEDEKVDKLDSKEFEYMLTTSKKYKILLSI